MSLRGAFYFEWESAAAGDERGAGRAGGRHGDGVVHADEHSGLRGKLEVLALARDDVRGAAREAEAETAGDVAEDRADEGAAAGADGPADDVALNIMLFLDDLAFFNFHVFAALAFGLPARLLDGDDAHLHGDEAAVDFNGAEGEVHVGLAAENGKVAGLLHRADDAVHTRTGGQQQLGAEVDGLGDDGDERVAILCHGAADAAQEREMNLRPLNDLTRFGVRRGSGGADESCRQEK